MNKREKANRRAKSAIIEYLVYYDPPEHREEAITLWEDLTIDKLLEAKNYNVARNISTTILERYLLQYMNICIREAEKVKP